VINVPDSKSVIPFLVRGIRVGDLQIDAWGWAVVWEPPNEKEAGSIIIIETDRLLQVRSKDTYVSVSR